LTVIAEVREFFLDQAAGEFQCFNADGFLRFRRFIEQGKRRQIGIRQIVEQRNLFLFFHPFRFRHGDDLRFDTDRRRFDDLCALLHHSFFTLDGGYLTRACGLRVRRTDCG
jgi:hypothetical protein